MRTFGTQAFGAKEKLMAYTNPAHTPSTGAVIPASWGTTVNANMDVLQERAVGAEIFSAGVTVTTGDGKYYLPPMPTALNGYFLTGAIATVFAKSTSGTPTVQVARGRQAAAGTAHAFSDMFSTLLTVDANEYCSLDATAAVVIDTTYDDILTGDIIRIDVDVAGTGTTGLFVTLIFKAYL